MDSTRQPINNIITLEYVDAMYFYKRPSKWSSPTTYTVLGKLIHSSKDQVIIGFTQTNNKSERGLLIPTNAIIFLREAHTYNETEHIHTPVKKGLVVGITWKDIVYFDNGIIPTQATEMYSEGKIVFVAKNYIVLHNTNTLSLSNKKVKNFPDTPKKPAYFLIPKPFISNIEKYEKK